MKLPQIMALAAADINNQRPLRDRALDDLLRGIHLGPRREVISRMALHDVVEVGREQRVRTDVLEEDGVGPAPVLEVAVVLVRRVPVSVLLEVVRQRAEHGVRQLAVEAAVHGRQRCVLAEGLGPGCAGVGVEVCFYDEVLACYRPHHAS